MHQSNPNRIRIEPQEPIASQGFIFHPLDATHRDTVLIQQGSDIQATPGSVVDRIHCQNAPRRRCLIIVNSEETAENSEYEACSSKPGICDAISFSRDEQN